MKSEEIDQESLDRISEAFAGAIRRGEQPSVSTWVARHGDEDGRLGELLTSVAMIEGLKSSSSTKGGNPAQRHVDSTPTQLDDYRIVKEIGRGGMGIVFEAIHQSLERRVAIKVLADRWTGDSEALRRFSSEARAAAKLRHPHIVPVYGVGHADDYHYFVMDLIEGQSLAEWLSRQNDNDGYESETFVGESPATQENRYRFAATVGADICDALHYAHGQNVLHRDIKPGNLLVDSQQRVWIADFGLAKLTEQAATTKTGDLLGTPQYMPPESFSGKYDCRSEVYAIGLTLYELITGSPAIDGSSHADTIRLAMEGATQSPSQIQSDVPSDLDTIIAKSLARDPALRYATTGELADDLRRYLAGRPIHARRVGPFERAYRWSRREPLIAGLMAATIVSLSTALAVAVFGYLKTSSALDQTTVARRSAENSRDQLMLALELAETHQHRAESNLQVAVDAFDEIMQNISGRGEVIDSEFLGELIGVQSRTVSAADAELLKSLLGFFDELAANNSKDLRRQSADASRRAGDIYQRLGQFDQADEAYERARRMLESIFATTGDIEALVTQAKILNEQGAMAGLQGQPLRVRRLVETTTQTLSGSAEAMQTVEGRYEYARAKMLITSLVSNIDRAPANGPGNPPRHRGGASPMMVDSAFEAIDVLKELVEESPENESFQLALARAYRNASSVAGKLQRPAQARFAIRQSIVIIEHLLEADAESETIKYELAKTLAIGSWLGQDDLLRLRRAVRISDSLLQKNPDVARYQAIKAHTLNTIALVQMRSNRHDAAIATLQEKLAIERKIVAAAPDLLVYQVQMAITQHRIAEIQHASGAHDKAMESLRQAIETLAPFGRRSSPSNIAQAQLNRFRQQLQRWRRPAIQSESAEN